MPTCSRWAAVEASCWLSLSGVPATVPCPLHCLPPGRRPLLTSESACSCFNRAGLASSLPLFYDVSMLGSAQGRHSYVRRPRAGHQPGEQRGGRGSGVGHPLAVVTGAAVLAWGPWLKRGKHWVEAFLGAAGIWLGKGWLPWQLSHHHHQAGRCQRLAQGQLGKAECSDRLRASSRWLSRHRQPWQLGIWGPCFVLVIQRLA